MTIDELCQRFGIQRATYYKWKQRYNLPNAIGPKGPGARYGRPHVEAIQAILRLRHHNVSAKDAARYCQEAGISLPQYVAQREQSLRDFGLGVA